MTQPRIKIGDPQPLDCPNCKEKMGYQYSDSIRIDYITYHLSDGSVSGGSYGDSEKRVNSGVTCSCMNCGTKLPFKMDRN